MNKATGQIKCYFQCKGCFKYKNRYIHRVFIYSLLNISWSCLQIGPYLPLIWAILKRVTYTIDHITVLKWGLIAVIFAAGSLPPAWDFVARNLYFLPMYTCIFSRNHSSLQQSKNMYDSFSGAV